MSLKEDIPNVHDLFLFYKKLYRPASIADIPLKIEFENSLTTPDPGYEGYRPGARQMRKNIISSCAIQAYSLDGIEIILRFPRLVCQYLPHRKCKYDNHKAAILLFNHEIIHCLFQHIGEYEADFKWDTKFIVNTLSDYLPDVYCRC